TDIRSHERAAAAIVTRPVDVTFAGIGENAHIAFNEPPADFETEEPYITVALSDETRRHQLPRWFAALDEVPANAVTMSVRQILKSRKILVIVTGTHKARAVQRSFFEEATPDVPASALQQHADVTVYLDRYAASLLEP